MEKMDESKEREKRKRQILQAALATFSQKGYNRTVLDEIAQQAGVAKGTVYLYFKDKEDLFYQVLMFIIDSLAEAVEEAIRDTMNPLEKLHSLALCQLQYFSQDKNLLGIFQTLLHDNLLSTHQRFFKSLMEKKIMLIEYITDIVEAGKKGGFIRQDIETEDIVNAYDGTTAFIIRHMAMEQMGDTNTGRLFDGEKRVSAAMKILYEGIAAKK